MTYILTGLGIGARAGAAVVGFCAVVFVGILALAAIATVIAVVTDRDGGE